MTMHSGDEVAVCDWNSIPVLKHRQFSKGTAHSGLAIALVTSNREKPAKAGARYGLVTP